MPPCISFILDDQRNFYRDPSTDRASNVLTNASLPWPTLDTLLDKTSPSSRYPTGLAQEYSHGLALTLASSVLHLHGTGWLPEHWSKNCVHFRRTLDSEEPYVVAAFNASLCETSRRSQLGPNPYLVGLGIVLLELAQQATFESWVCHKYDIPADDDNLRKAYLGDLWADQACSNHMISERYMGVVKRCLWACGSPCQVSQTVDSLQLWQTVYFEILQPLRDELSRRTDNLSLEA